MKLFEFAPTRSIRARWTLQELNVEFEAVTVNLIAGEHRSPAFLKINPAGKLPALVDGDMVLTESVAIVLYLAEKYPDRGLIPTDLQERAQLMRWLLFTTTELEQPLWRISRHTAIYPEDKRLPADVALARDDFAAMVKVAEEHMRGREFVVGDTVTVADFALAYTLDWAQVVNLLNGLPCLEELRRADVRTATGADAHQGGLCQHPELSSGAPRGGSAGKTRGRAAGGGEQGVNRGVNDGTSKPKARSRGAMKANAVTIYGIKNCDTMKKARAWLDARGVAYAFHDYKTAGIERGMLEKWAREAGWETLLNRAGTTFRALPEKDKDKLTGKKAIALMVAQPSMIKRPVLDVGGKLLVGFKPEQYEKAFGARR